MGKFMIEGNKTFIEVPWDKNVEPVLGMAKSQPMIAKPGCEVWFTATIEINSKYEETRLSAEFVGDLNDPNDNAHRSRAGFWIGVKDNVNKNEFASPAYDCSKGEKIGVNINNWNFGERPEIGFFNPKKDYSSNQIPLAICVTPWFNVNGNESKETMLNFEIKGREHGSTLFDKLDSKSITFILNDKEEPQDDDIKLRLMRDYGGFETTGDGSCIHPKQLCTLSNLEEELKKFDNPVKIGYIGTDTTENIRSIIRYLKSNQNLFSKISCLSIFKTEKYDQRIVEEHPSLTLNEEMGEDKFKIEINSLPKDGTLPKGITPVEITISTYVTPWAIKDENKQQYSDLLQVLMGKDNSILIAVDPKQSECLVRARVKEFNLSNYYINELNLEQRKNYQTRLKNKTAEALIWFKEVSP